MLCIPTKVAAVNCHAVSPEFRKLWAGMYGLASARKNTVSSLVVRYLHPAGAAAEEFCPAYRLRGSGAFDNRQSQAPHR